MLIKLLKKPHIPFDYKTHERLICLENNLRRSSVKKWKLEDYSEWLEHAELNVPVSKTLRLDLKIYAEMCDDVLNPKSAKILQLDEKATNDAVSYLLGHAWLNSPLKPKIYSSTVRCLLLAMNLKQEIKFQYHKLDLSNFGEYVTTEQVGIPIQLIPGTDSGYFLFWIKNSKNKDHLININIARIFPNTMRFTDLSQEDVLNKYVDQPKIYSKTIEVIAEDDHVVLKRLQSQFDGIERDSTTHASVDVPHYLDLMIRDLLKSFSYRTFHRKGSSDETKNNLPIDLTQIAKYGLKPYQGE